jgi:hypothetical protein
VWVVWRAAGRRGPQWVMNVHDRMLTLACLRGDGPAAPARVGGTQRRRVDPAGTPRPAAPMGGTGRARAAGLPTRGRPLRAAAGTGRATHAPAGARGHRVAAAGLRQRTGRYRPTRRRGAGVAAGRAVRGHDAPDRGNHGRERYYRADSASSQSFELRGHIALASLTATRWPRSRRNSETTHSTPNRADSPQYRVTGSRPHPRLSKRHAPPRSTVVADPEDPAIPGPRDGAH